MSDSNDDSTGYGRPPKATRFKKGRSGNPSGRAKGSKNLATVLNRTLRERVTVTENGRRRSITKLDAAVKQLVNKAASGDERYSRQFFKVLAGVEKTTESPTEATQALSAADREVLAGILARLESAESGGDDENQT